MSNDTSRSRSPFIFVILVFVLSIPFYWLGERELLPKGMPVHLPAVTFMVFNPIIAATILTIRQSGAEGAKRLLKRIFHFEKTKARWYVLALVMMPFIMALVFILMNLTGRQVPYPQISIPVPPLLFAVFFIFAIGEEAGWSGYITEPLQEKWGALAAGIAIGIVGAAWHFAPYVWAHGLNWAIWQCLVTVMLRVVIVWLFNNAGGSVLIAVLFHTMINESDFIFPIYGSYYDPIPTAIIMAPFVGAIIFLWGPHTLARYRWS